MNNDYILSAIREYADEWLKEPRWHLPKGHFEQRSYQKWAVNEVIKYIRESETVSPIEAVEKFVYKMNALSRKKNVIFSIAYDVATDILDFLIAMDGTRYDI